MFHIWSPLLPGAAQIQAGVAASAPVNTVPGAQTATAGVSLAISGISVTDADGDLSTVALSVVSGTLTVSLSGGATISAGANGSSALTLSGTESEINAALATLTYLLASAGTDTLTVLSTDGGSLTDSDTVSITIAAAVVATTAPEAGGAGAPLGKSRKGHSGPHAPAFGQRRGTVIEYPVRDADLVVTPDVEIEKPDAKPAPELQSTSPLPVVMDFGAGPIAIGMQIPLSEKIHNELMADDEDALIAILLAID